MNEKRIKELVDIAMSSFDGTLINREELEKQLKESEYLLIDEKVEYVTTQVENTGKFPRSCMFIGPDRDFGFKGCDDYKKLKRKSRLRNPQLQVCEGLYTAKQRYSGGGPITGPNDQLIVAKIPFSCKGCYKDLFVERLKKAMEFRYRSW